MCSEHMVGTFSIHTKYIDTKTWQALPTRQGGRIKQANKLLTENIEIKIPERRG